MRKFILALAVLSLSGCKSGVLNKKIVFKTKAGNVVFSHQYHCNVKGLHCSQCHPKIFKKKDSMVSVNSCAHCHNGRVAFSIYDKQSCSRCHKGKMTFDVNKEKCGSIKGK